MRDIDGQVSGGTLTEDVRIHGQVTGDVTVPTGRALELHGQLTDRLFIEHGGSAIVRGQVARDVVNEGELEFYGMIVGRLSDPAGKAKIAPEAKILGH